MHTRTIVTFMAVTSIALVLAVSAQAGRGNGAGRGWGGGGPQGGQFGRCERLRLRDGSCTNQTGQAAGQLPQRPANCPRLNPQPNR